MPSQNFKIAIIGTHFVGKSTLCRSLVNYLRSKNKNVGMIEEVVRDCPYPINEMATAEAQDWILEEQKRRESELEKKHDFIVMDRGVIDNFAYWNRVAEKTDLPKKIIEEKKKEVFEHSKNYDIIIFLQPFSAKITDDRFRSIDPAWRNEMHERVNEIINEFKVNYKTPVFMVDGFEKDVIEEVKNIIRKNIYK